MPYSGSPISGVGGSVQWNTGTVTMNAWLFDADINLHAVYSADSAPFGDLCAGLITPAKIAFNGTVYTNYNPFQLGGSAGMTLGAAGECYLNLNSTLQVVLANTRVRRWTLGASSDGACTINGELWGSWIYGGLNRSNIFNNGNL